MARMENTVLVEFLRLDQERGRLMGQIKRNSEVLNDVDFEAAMAGIESAVKQMRVLHIQQQVLHRVIEETKRNKEREEENGRTPIAPEAD